MTESPKPAPWRVRREDDWWNVYLSDGSLGAKFVREGDALTYADLAGPGSPLTRLFGLDEGGPA